MVLVQQNEQKGAGEKWIRLPSNAFHLSRKDRPLRLNMTQKPQNLNFPH